MSVIKTVATRQISLQGSSIAAATASLDGLLTVTLEQDDANGQLFLRFAGKLGNESIDHKHSLGSEDGNDALAGLPVEQIAAELESAIDQKIAKVTNRIGSRLGIKSAADLLAGKNP